MPRRLISLAVLAAMCAALPALASDPAPEGKYRGKQRKGKAGNGSAHRVSFTVRQGKLRKLVIRRGQAYCRPPAVRQPGFAPGYFDAPSPRLARFPPARLRRGKSGRYFVRVTYRRTRRRWRITRSRSRAEGPGYVTIRGRFAGRRFVPIRAVNLTVRYGADAEGRPTFGPGVQQCTFAGRLRARRLKPRR